VQGGDKLSLAMSMIPGKAADEIVPAVKAAQKQIKAYHGTPHDFDKFDISKIGTGEGAQAYGHGLYFADSEKVAKSYRDNLSRPSFAETASGTPISSDVSRLLEDSYNDLLGGPGNMSSNIPGDAVRWADQKLADQMDDAKAAGDFEWFNKIRDQRNELSRMRDDPLGGKGHMYEVNINADPDAFLDWDKPLSEHSEATRQAIAAAAANFEPRGPLAKGINQNLRSGNLNLTGEQAYTGIGGLSGGPEKIAASEVLRQAGIPGIKYLDAGSRGAGGNGLATARRNLQLAEQDLAANPSDRYLQRDVEDWRSNVAAEEKALSKASRNYVVFSDEIIDIVKKYGIVGALGAGLITQQMADQLQAQQGGGQS
jgi:hypothetical protein